MTKRSTTGAVLALALLAALGGPAAAQVRVNTSISDHDPASILIFPIFISDFTNGYASAVTVTNTNGDRRVVIPGPPQGFRGDVQAHYYWVDGLGNWPITNDQAFLTPNDTRSILTDFNGDSEQGFLVVAAEDPETSLAIDFDYLIGDIILIDVGGNRTWNLPAIGIKALVDERLGGAAVRTTRGHGYTDAEPPGVPVNGGDGDTRFDFNGIEYQRWPSTLFLSSFFRQSNGVNGSPHEGEVIFLTDLNADWQVNLRFLLYDRDETETSQTRSFVCWTRIRLLSVSTVTGSAGYDPAGWARVDAPTAQNLVIGGPPITDPNLLGAMVQRILGQTGLEYGHLLHHSGVNPRDAEMALN